MTGRRSVLASVASGFAVVSGCLGLGGSSDSAEVDHPAVGEVADHPTLGSTDDAPTTRIVAFEDPSCSTCAIFATETLPTLRAEAIDGGRLAYQWRGLPWVESWSETATEALYTVYDRDVDAFWRLKDRFYEIQSGVTESTVRERTRKILEEIDVDSSDVFESLDAEGHADRIDANERAAEESDVTAVPSFVLFRDGEYVTTVVGAQSYEVFEGALGL